MGKVLITGGSGFIASHVVLELLRHEHQVVATVRSQAKGEALRRVMPAEVSSLLTCTIVEDISIPHAFDTVLSAHSFDAVIHTASPFHFMPLKSPKDMLDPAINGTKNLLDSIKRLAPTVKRFIATSSQGAIVDTSKLHRPGYTYTADDWCPIDWNTANGSDPGLTYQASKTFAERAIWDFAEKHPALEVVTILPPMTLGPVLIRPESMSSLNTSNASIYMYINGSLKGTKFPPQYIHGWCDVRDVARAHVAAYENPKAANSRFLVSAGNYTYKEVADIIAKNFPDTVGNLPTGFPEGFTPDGLPVEGRHTFDAGPSKTVLGLEYITLEKSVVDVVNCLREFEKGG